ncbi:MAG: PVC-type heme-binding CxxCH protein, partial [Bryobacteraceae bacterium]
MMRLFGILLCLAAIPYYWAQTRQPTRDGGGNDTVAAIEPNRGGEVDLSAQDPKVALSRLKVADGYQINLFASEMEFPIGKAVAMTFDGRGRLWVATMPTYPHYYPGKPPDDKLIILEDTNGDGKADKHTVFASGLYLAAGFELGYGGVFIAQQPNLVFLKDTNGDDVADERHVVLHGFGTEDSHHAIHAFTWGPAGELYLHEGTFHHSQVETPWGTVRVDEAAVFRYEPRTQKLGVFVSYPFANPWGHCFDPWGQDFIADASGGSNYFAAAFSGHVDYPRKHPRMREFTTTKVRPTCGCEIVTSRQFPEEAQGNFLLNNTIGFHGIKQHRIIAEGSGFTTQEIEPLLQSSDINFRPVDLKFGPDGALYLVDWFNPLVGHMQYSLRDSRRDRTHGRIWRITYKGRPTLRPAAIEGRPIPELLDQLKVYETRARYRARRELWGRDPKQVEAALKRWVAALDPADPGYEHSLLEALWLYQNLDVVEAGLLGKLLRAKDHRARAAATRVVRYWN